MSIDRSIVSSSGRIDNLCKARDLPFLVTLCELLPRVGDSSSQEGSNSDHQVLEFYQDSSFPNTASSCRQWDECEILLTNISGEAREGEILAILGASGSGKPTLIDALADRMARESLKGTITLNGEVLESRLLKLMSAYVMKDDLLFPMLTVEETLMFSAEFRLPRSVSKSRKKARVQALIDQLGLGSAAKTVIGDEGHRGVSGGEQRRVSIGIDIIHDPILLFLNEPTSGFDSTSA
ncbi:hypothetical protein ACH5RR_005387 [Cinchona calisaya]|uniref:ABC transporter domain-containing protein n=1 Tax=Cinchona calisaya TaxID=153742 RepID=A0ABD3AL38_9GENT